MMNETNYILLITFENNRVTWFYPSLDLAIKDKDYHFAQAKERGIVNIEVFEKCKADQ